MLKKQAQEHLLENIIPFWKNLIDTENGGFYGYVGFDLSVDKLAKKGMILNSRILWLFATAARVLKDESLLFYAKHAYNFLCDKGMDREDGGIYWSLQYDGSINESFKYTYNQAFAIYGLTAYYEATKDPLALQLAFNLYDLIEGKCRDESGYLEAFYKDFSIMENDNLSENGVIADKTMNTLLHLLEAYTQLYKVSQKVEVKERLVHLLQLFEEKVYNAKLQRQEVFFDKDWNSILDLHSYGHDIETSWLIDECTTILKDATIQKRMTVITDALVRKVFAKAYKNNSLLNECEKGIDDTTRVWWVQAETVVGLVNAYQKHPEKREYYEAAQNTLQYIFDNMVDKREGSEWIQEVDENGEPISKPFVSPWKCPYHNGRMCLELIERDVVVPINKKATKEAANLLQYLHSVSGKGIITGQHTQTIPMEEVTYIEKLTGKKPALCGFELLSYSSNFNYENMTKECEIEIEENRNTIEQAIAWAEKEKGIVTFSWHWFSPTGGSDKSFYTRHTDFDATKIFVKDTKEQIAFYKDLDFLASKIQIFKDKNIPVLFRPFHEADGDWFWWGAKGPVVARDLFILVYQYFVETYGFHNLLWVWNAISKEGYPGDFYVDVISRDIYVEKQMVTDYEKEYEELICNTTREKVVALAECGVIPDISMLEKSKIPWSYYMTWSKEFCIGEEYNIKERVKAMYNSKYAITLDSLNE